VKGGGAKDRQPDGQTASQPHTLRLRTTWRLGVSASDPASRDYVSPVVLGTAYLGLGMLDEALGELERAHHERRGWVAYLDAEQMFDHLRGMPRVEELRRRMGLATANG
jgi:hypothetical protein